MRITIDNTNQLDVEWHTVEITNFGCCFSFVRACFRLCVFTLEPIRTARHYHRLCEHT